MAIIKFKNFNTEHKKNLKKKRNRICSKIDLKRISACPNPLSR